MTFTCITCRVIFADAELQRQHYKEDWHRYNLKRKVAELPPVSAESFNQRVLAQRAATAEPEKKCSNYCQLCRKNFNTVNAYTNHINSKKHKEAEARPIAENQQQPLSESERVAAKNAQNQALKEAMHETSTATSGATTSASGATAATLGEPQASGSMEVDEGSDDEEDVWDGEALGQEECLFCSKVSKSLEDNVNHMTSQHSFFIPHIEFLADLDGLIEYLGAKVGEGHMCLWCNASSKSFRSTQAVQQHMVDKGHCKMSFQDEDLFEYTDFYKYEDAGEDEPMQSEEGEVEEDEEEDVQRDDDGSIYQLVLPSGAVLGHRSLQRYYRQKLSAKQAAETKGHRAIRNVISQYKALGWTGATGVECKRRAKDLKFVQRMKNKYQTRLSVKANKFQPHFRPQVVF